MTGAHPEITHPPKREENTMAADAATLTVTLPEVFDEPGERHLIAMGAAPWAAAAERDANPERLRSLGLGYLALAEHLGAES